MGTDSCAAADPVSRPGTHRTADYNAGYDRGDSRNHSGSARPHGAGEPFCPGLTPLWKSPAAVGPWPNPISELAQDEYSGHGDEETDKIIPTNATGSMKSLAISQWHLIVHEKRGIRLYDLKNDPHELRDVANTPENRSLALSLAAQIQQFTAPGFEMSPLRISRFRRS